MFHRPAPTMVRSAPERCRCWRCTAGCSRIAPVPPMSLSHRPRGPPHATGPTCRIGPVLRSLPQMIVLVDLNKLTSRSHPRVRRGRELARRCGPSRPPSSPCTSFLRRPLTATQSPAPA